MQDIETQPRRTPTRLLTAGAVIGGAIILLVVALILTNEQGPPPESNVNLWALVPAAFLAGVFSFLSPCTLPLLPAYFAFTFQSGQKRVTLMTVAFFLGLATTLTLLGASATALSRVLFQSLESLTLIGGLIVIGMGVMSLLGKGFAGPQLQERPAATLVGTYVYGATFALGWSACVGPILGAILTLLATQGGAIAQGALLAFIYSLGLGAPLILVASFFGRLGHGTRFWRIIKGRGFTLRLGPWSLDLHTTSVLSGLLLIFMGYLLASGQMTALTQLAAGSDLSLWIIQLEERIGRLFGLY